MNGTFWKKLSLYKIAILSILCLCSCQENSSNNATVDTWKPFIKNEKFQHLELPLLTPCPSNWNETEFDAGRGHTVTYCEPPELSSIDSSLSLLSPDFLPCPEGWRSVEDRATGIVTCDPYPEGGALDCGVDRVDHIHFLGNADCSQIGTKCPNGDWASNIPQDLPLYYVKAGGEAGGNGSDTAPFGSINEALGTVERDAILALSKGTFNEVVNLPPGIILWGACVAETIITSTSVAEKGPVITVEQNNGEVRNLQITGRRTGVSLEGYSSSLLLEDVLINKTYIVGIRALQGHLMLKNVVIRDTRSRPSDGAFGHGLLVHGGARVDAQMIVIQNNRTYGIQADGEGTTLRLEDIAIRDTQSQLNDRNYGNGLVVQNKAEVEVTRAAFQNNRFHAILLYDEGTTLRLRDGVIQDTQSRESDTLWGSGLAILDGPDVEVQRTLFERNTSYAIHAEQEGTQAKFTNIVVRDTEASQFDNSVGRGLRALFGADVELSRSIFQKNKDVGVFVDGKGTTARLEHVTIRDTQSRQSDGWYGIGLEVQNEAHAEVISSIFFNNRDVGLFIADMGTTAQIEHVIVRETQSRLSDGRVGIGLEVSYGAQVEVMRSMFQNNREIGVMAFSEKTRLEMEHVLITGTKQRQCASEDREDSYEPCYSEECGNGIGAYDGASIDLYRFILSNNFLCGAQLAFGQDIDGMPLKLSGMISFSQGVISNNGICGLNVQDEGFDLDAAMEETYFFENNYNNLDSNLLPVP